MNLLIRFFRFDNHKSHGGHRGRFFFQTILGALSVLVGYGFLDSHRSAQAQTTSTWNGTTGSWSDFTRWSTNPLFPNNGNGGNDYNAIINGGTVTLDQDIEIEGLSFSGGTINGGFDLFVNEVFSWSDGTMDGGGQTTIAPGGSLNINFGVPRLNRPLENNGEANLAGGLMYIIDGFYLNNETTNWNSGGFTAFMEDGTVQNEGTFNVVDNSTNNLGMAGVGGTNVFNNNGTFTKTGTGTTRFFSFMNGVAFNNEGTVNILEGTLSLESGGSGSGQFNVAPGATLKFMGSGFNYTGGISLGGGTLQVSTYTLNAGTLGGNGTIAATTFTNASEISPGFSVGHIQVSGNYTQTSAGNLTIEIEGMSDFDTFNVTGTATFGGSLSVLIPNDGSVQAGDTFTVITAGATMGTKFKDVFTVGNDDLFVKPVYNENEISLYMSDEGDMNQLGDGVNEDDVMSFAMALTNPDMYDSQHDADSREAGDIDDDGDCDVDDIDDFAEILGMSIAALTHRIQAYSTQVPEPSSAVLAGMVLMIGTLCRRSGFRPA